jgi:hypothetical protein
VPVRLSSAVRDAQLQAFATMCDGGTIILLNANQVIGRLALPTPAFTRREPGVYVAIAAPEDNSADGEPTTWTLQGRDGKNLASGLVGDEIVVTPTKVRAGARLVPEPIILTVEADDGD